MIDALHKGKDFIRQLRQFIYKNDKDRSLSPKLTKRRTVFRGRYC